MTLAEAFQGDGAKWPRVYDWAAAKLPAKPIFDSDQPTHHRPGDGPPSQIAAQGNWRPVQQEYVTRARWGPYAINAASSMGRDCNYNASPDHRGGARLDKTEYSDQIM